MHSAAREASGVPAAGPAMTVLGTMLTRIAAIIRGVAAGYVLVQVVIWHAYYQASPGELWGPAVAAGWAAAAVWYLRRHRFPPWPLVCLDWAVYAGLAVTAGGCVPLAIRGQAAEWLFVTVASGLLVQVWFTPARLSMPLSLMSGLAFWLASCWPRAVTPPAGPAPRRSRCCSSWSSCTGAAGRCCTGGPAGRTARWPRPTGTPGTSSSSCPGPSSAGNRTGCCTTPC